MKYILIFLLILCFAFTRNTKLPKYWIGECDVRTSKMNWNIHSLIRAKDYNEAKHEFDNMLKKDRDLKVGTISVGSYGIYEIDFDNCVLKLRP